MKAVITRTCPRCDHDIEPGQEMVPMPRGWTHSTCVKAQVNTANRTSVRVESETQSGPDLRLTDQGLATVSTTPKGA